MKDMKEMRIREIQFKQAQPIWLEGREREMNVQAGFISRFVHKKGERCTLRITGAALYRIFINGTFVHYGPARAPHGYARVDELDIGGYLSEGLNVLAIEAAGYYVYNYYTVLLPSFLQAEVEQEGVILRSTGKEEDFQAVLLSMRVQKCMRYSFQRHFSEVYHLDGELPLYDWAAGGELEYVRTAPAAPEVKYLEREVPVPEYAVAEPVTMVETGTVSVQPHEQEVPYLQMKFVHNLNDQIRGYAVEEIEDRPFETVQDCLFTRKEDGGRELFPVSLTGGQYVLYDMGYNNTGFIQAEMYAQEDSEVYFIFDEKLIDGKFDIKEWKTINIVCCHLKRGERLYSLESFEAYGFQYIQCMVLKGRITLRQLSLREYSYPRYRNTGFECEDKQISGIFEAAVQTYRQNTLDIFMDCPTRERAGWLCDSYFTAQAAAYFSGECTVEKVMLENYVLAPHIPFIADGMLPACYPADSPDGRYIPQWAMWYIVELEGYWKRNTKADKGIFQSLCYRLLDFLAGYRNADGLLEKLDKWNFIEWSAANGWVQDVNYPTNMLYSKVLHLVGEWYEDAALLGEARRVKDTVVEQSFDGSFFIDNAVRREDGRLEVTDNRSEVCQYYALFFGIADVREDRYKVLYDTVLHVFGPERKKKQSMPGIAYANAFIGNFLRLELLLAWREYGLILKELAGYYGEMAERTGTLWEHDDIVRGSLNHGFASFVGAAIARVLLGIEQVNPLEGSVVFDFNDVAIAASGYVDTVYGRISVKRTVENGRVSFACSVPSKAKVEVRVKEADAEIEYYG